MAEPKTVTEALTSPTGATLAMHVFHAPKKPKAVIHINHGMSEHGLRYERFAGALASAGYCAIAHDHRGHGGTTAPDAFPGYFAREDGWNKVMQDVAAANAEIARRHPDTPIICFGHSMGSIISLNYAIQYPQTIAAAAFWNSGVDGGALLVALRTLLKLERMFKGSDTPSALAQKLTFDIWNKKFAPNRTEFDWLSTIEAEVDTYIADPLCGTPATNKLWLDLSEGIALGASNASLQKIPADLPLHLVAGGDDPCTENGKAMERLLQRLQDRGMKDAELTTYPDTRHETLNDRACEKATQQFITWLNRII